MPEGYTHVRTGERAIDRSKLRMWDFACFAAGANGPDPLFYYRVWQQGAKNRLPAIGKRMHNERTGEFLFTLVNKAVSPAQKMYAAGFLTHYAVDKNVHPYVKFVTDGAQAVYGERYGHGLFEIALDSHLYNMDFSTGKVSPDHSSPIPNKRNLHQIAILLHMSIREVYGEYLEIKALEDSFSHMYRIRRLLVCDSERKSSLLNRLEKKITGSCGYLSGHIVPAPPLRSLPVCWANPFTGEKENTSVFDLLELGEDEAVKYINAACDYWRRQISIESAKAIWGSLSYETNMLSEV